MSEAVLIAVGIDWDGRRQILAVEMAACESRSAWKDFFVKLKGRGLRGVELVYQTIMPASWRRSRRHFQRPPGSAVTCTLRNALDHLPRKHGDDCLQELRWLYDRRDLDEAKTDLSAWLTKWSARYLDQLGRGDNRTDADLLPIATPASQALEINQHS